MEGSVLSRRRILQSLGLVGGVAASSLLAACGGGGGGGGGAAATKPAEKAAGATTPAAGAATPAAGAATPAAGAATPAAGAAATKPAEKAAAEATKPAAEKSKEPPGKEAAAGKEAPKPEPTAIVGEAGKGATVIQFWNGLTGTDGEGMQRLMEKWAQQNTEVTVKHQRIPWATFYTKLSSSLVAGSPPEMWIFHSEQIIRYASRGLMKQLDDFAKTGGIPLDDMGYTLPAAQYEGKLYAVPLDQYTWCLIFNKDIVKAGGLDPEKPPTTLQEWQEWGRKTTMDNNGKKAGEPGFDPKNIKHWGFYYSTWGAMWESMLLQQGLPGYYESPDSKDVLSDRPEAIKALEEMASWREQHQFAPAPTGINVMEGYYAGKAAIVYNGVWNVNGMKRNAHIPHGVGVTPTFFQNNKSTFGGHQMAMPNQLQGKPLEEAWKTIKFISDNGLEWAKEGQTPARKSILASKEFQELWPQNIFAKQVAYSRPPIPHLKIQEIGDQIGPAVDAALNGQKSPADALKEAAQRQREALARRD